MPNMPQSDMRQHLIAALAGQQPQMVSDQPPPQYPVSPGAGMGYLTLPDMNSAQQALNSLQTQGRSGFITPIGPDGQGGFEVRHWTSR